LTFKAKGMKEMLKVAIIGLGDVSFIHRKAIEESTVAELVAVCDVNPTKHELYRDIPFYTQIDDLLKKQSLDVVHICLPHDLHVPVAKQVINEGVAVFLEKPVGLNYQEAKALADEVTRLNAKVGVCFQNRYNKTVKVLKEKLASEDYGQLVAVKGLVAWGRPLSYYTSKPWRGMMARAGGGTIINQAIHTYDLMQYLAGDIVDVKASLSNMTDYPIEVEDTAVAQINFSDGVHGFAMSTNAYAANSSVELQVILERGKLTIKDYQLYETTDLGKVCIAEDNVSTKSKSYYGPSHQEAIDAFYQALLTETNDYITVQDALPSMIMLDLMKQSSKTGERINKGEYLHDS